MNRNLIKIYIGSQPIKIIKKFDLATNKIECQNISFGENIQNIKDDEELSHTFILVRLVNELGYAPDRNQERHKTVEEAFGGRMCFYRSNK